MGQFLQVLGGVTLVVLALAAISSAVEAVVGVVKWVRELGVRVKELGRKSEVLWDRSNDARCRLKKLEDAIGPSEPVQ
jgi:hypothetical protein